MTIRAILAGRNGPVHTAEGSESVTAVVCRLTEQRIGAVPVMDGERVIGIFSERDVIHCLNAHGGDALGLLVRDVMTAPAITIDADTPILGALSLMTRRRIRHLPVVAGDALVGFISIGDLVKYRIESIEAEAAAMRDYIAGS
ncbi:CBS domain-containing protein [Sphingomonas lacunae]|uniref:CBS domain-containing protein n=1 Tax=Sphingomonas lacunae TaxID=2698828 RepID=A0A6M4ASI8_9SPHN|nr:CBS domain-containing protein [Sphingomonas lacunae]QJQ32047.1 CBS domain-containing protein [Sphingomonas lacunae]